MTPLTDARSKVKNIADTLKDTGLFSAFLKAARTAGLMKILEGAGSLTVFAPVDAAFEKLPRPDAEALMKDSGQLTEIITFHMVPGFLSISDVMGLRSMQTLLDARITVDACDGVKLNGASVIKADILCSNGIVHGIDTVLFPS